MVRGNLVEVLSPQRNNNNNNNNNNNKSSMKSSMKTSTKTSMYGKNNGRGGGKKKSVMTPTTPTSTAIHSLHSLHLLHSLPAPAWAGKRRLNHDRPHHAKSQHQRGTATTNATANALRKVRGVLHPLEEHLNANESLLRKQHRRHETPPVTAETCDMSSNSQIIKYAYKYQPPPEASTASASPRIIFDFDPGISLDLGFGIVPAKGENAMNTSVTAHAPAHIHAPAIPAISAIPAETGTTADTNNVLPTETSWYRHRHNGHTHTHNHNHTHEPNQDLPPTTSTRNHTTSQHDIFNSSTNITTIFSTVATDERINNRHHYHPYHKHHPRHHLNNKLNHNEYLAIKYNRERIERHLDYLCPPPYSESESNKHEVGLGPQARASNGPQAGPETGTGTGTNQKITADKIITQQHQKQGQQLLQQQEIHSTTMEPMTNKSNLDRSIPLWVDLTLTNNIDDADDSTISGEEDFYFNNNSNSNSNNKREGEGKIRKEETDNDDDVIIMINATNVSTMDTNDVKQQDIHITTATNTTSTSKYQELKLEPEQKEGNTRNKNMEIKVSKTFDTNNSPRGVDHYQEIQHNQKIPNNHNNNQNQYNQQLSRANQRQRLRQRLFREQHLNQNLNQTKPLIQTVVDEPEITSSTSATSHEDKILNQQQNQQQIPTIIRNDTTTTTQDAVSPLPILTNESPTNYNRVSSPTTTTTTTTSNTNTLTTTYSNHNTNVLKIKSRLRRIEKNYKEIRSGLAII